MTQRNGDHRWDLFRRTVDGAFEDAGCRRLSAINTAKQAIVKEEQRLREAKPTVFVAMPSYSATCTHDGAWRALHLWPSSNEDLGIMASVYSNSLLTRGFNHLWAEAVKRAEQGTVTHFAMLHSDVIPDPHWVDTLWEEMTRLDADIVSCVIPIKTTQGLTSTGMEIPGSQFMVRRLTMHEVMDLPETFNADDVTHAGLNELGGRLLVNTGCWIADLRKSWVHELDDKNNLKCHFTINDAIHKEADGAFCVGVEPEDWFFSRTVQDVAPEAKLYATRKVRCEHKGEASYVNDVAWGTSQRDDETLCALAEVVAAQPVDVRADKLEPEPESAAVPSG